ncbi:nuclear transport factor 2 family protein [Nocardioides sp. GXZ039]|uniref:nuclear transport factor 2 family protein n=1 Tax=Nocardioides sp. GXZ039 TaxID=3136018 RepID=UPI0030F3A1F3
MTAAAAEGVPAKGTGPRWPRWLEDLYQSADALDAAGFASPFGPSGTMRFGNGPTLTGSAEIEASLREFFAAVPSMQHQVLRVWDDGAGVIFEAVVTYGRPDGRSVDIPAVSAYTRSADDALQCRIYCDMAPVFAE